MVKHKEITKVDAKHQFAFYLEDITNFINSLKLVTLRNKDLHHRLSRVVKLAAGDTFILFNTVSHVVCELLEYTKQEVIIRIVAVKNNTIITPQIVYMLPLLKKEALQDAVYSLTEIGVNVIQLVVTQKSRQSITSKEFERLKKTIISAAEQSKNYVFPDLQEAVTLSLYVSNIAKNSNKILFDVDGTSFFTLRSELQNKDCCLMVGPEGGLVKDEIDLLKKNNFKLCLLTPTVLRAVQAVAVSSALCRLQ
ncbi:MAG: hypothetical protein CL947_01585 [Epsilonproteobacteria bacterium]|nr:hypothetical protein [Campylobacterota bacterium]|tara:strand:+ start:1905 stop:2657 length:753 start_codon:yes stop_codon:yes gene_type:complete